MNQDTNLLLDIQFADIFSHSMGFLFIFLMVSFEIQKYSFTLCAFGIILKKISA